VISLLKLRRGRQLRVASQGHKERKYRILKMPKHLQKGKGRTTKITKAILELWELAKRSLVWSSFRG
jgi:hypothetical protein